MDKSHYLLFLTWIKMKNIFHHVNNFLNWAYPEPGWAAWKVILE